MYAYLIKIILPCQYKTLRILLFFLLTCKTLSMSKALKMFTLNSFLRIESFHCWIQVCICSLYKEGIGRDTCHPCIFKMVWKCQRKTRWFLLILHTLNDILLPEMPCQAQHSLQSLYQGLFIFSKTLKKKERGI